MTTTDPEALYANARKRSLTPDGYTAAGATKGLAHGDAIRLVFEAGVAAGIERARDSSGCTADQPSSTSNDTNASTQGEPR